MSLSGPLVEMRSCLFMQRKCMEIVGGRLTHWFSYMLRSPLLSKQTTCHLLVKQSFLSECWEGFR